ncbi:MAG: hypothetical protein ABGY96_07215 [bacterium]|nr:hypothetical protein [Gammaproteobacteria bacterium]HIL97197.1 hypothetical protein [Pseudomonadales bacterium]
MTDTLHQVRFNARMTGEFSFDITKQRFGRFFRLGEPAVKKLFSGREFVIKTGLSEDNAIKFAMKVAETGCECVIESMPGADPLEQRQRTADRRRRYRRDPRASSLVPDQRREIRRQDDQDYFEILVLKTADIPVAFRSYPTTLQKRF